MDSFWVADQRWMRDVYITLGLLAGATRRVLLGTRVTDPYIRHPALTAAAIATLDEASSGRAVLGIGAGGSGFAQLGLQREHPVTAIREAVTLIRKLWAGGVAEYRGEIVTWNGGGLEFPSRSDIPVVLAARSPRSLQLAGEIADGVIIAAGATRNAVAWARKHVAAGERLASRSAGATEILHMTYVAIDRDPAAARLAARDAVYGAVVGSHPRYEFLAASGLRPPRELTDYLDGGGRDRREVTSRITDDMVRALAVTGSEEDCAQKVAALIDAGVQHVLLAPVPTPDTTAVQCLTRFTTVVLPQLAEAAAAPSPCVESAGGTGRREFREGPPQARAGDGATNGGELKRP
jgi:5,10-methylenetetrahydromethanopterin reductase